MHGSHPRATGTETKKTERQRHPATKTEAHRGVGSSVQRLKSCARVARLTAHTACWHRGGKPFGHNAMRHRYGHCPRICAMLSSGPLMLITAAVSVSSGSSAQSFARSASSGLLMREPTRPWPPPWLIRRCWAASCQWPGGGVLGLTSGRPSMADAASFNCCTAGWFRASLCSCRCPRLELGVSGKGNRQGQPTRSASLDPEVGNPKGNTHGWKAVVCACLCAESWRVSVLVYVCVCARMQTINMCGMQSYATYTTCGANVWLVWEKPIDAQCILLVAPPDTRSGVHDTCPFDIHYTWISYPSRTIHPLRRRPSSKTRPRKASQADL